MIKSPQHLTSYSAPQHLRCSQQLISSSTSYPLTPHHLSIKLIKAPHLCNSSSVLRHQSESPLQDGEPQVKTSTPRENIVCIKTKAAVFHSCLESSFSGPAHTQKKYLSLQISIEIIDPLYWVSIVVFENVIFSF